MEALIAEQMFLFDKIKRALPSFNELNSAEVSIPIAQGRLKMLQTTWEKCEQLELRISLSASTSQVDKTQVAYYVNNEFLSAEKEFLKALDFFNEIIHGLIQENSESLISNVTIPGNNTSQNANNSQIVFHEYGIKLPDIQIPQFSGDYLDWPNFRDLFESTIHNKPRVPPVQKLYYLKTKLTGEALQLIKNITSTDENYEGAWNTIKSRYDNERALINSYLHSFLSLPNHANDTLKDLKILRDTTNEALMALKNLGCPTDNWDHFLVYSLVNKLHKNSLAEWEKTLSNSTTYPTYNDFSKFLDTRVRTLEALNMSKPDSKNANSFASRRSSAQSHSTSTSNASKCICCDGNHYLSQCQTFRKHTVPKRKEIAREHKLCFRCLRYSHRNRECKSKISCFQCKKPHHTLMHIEQSSPNSSEQSFSQVNSSQGQSTSSNQTPSNNSVDRRVQEPTNNTTCNVMSTDSEINLRCFQSTKTLLATAKIRICAHNGREIIARAFLDQGSDATFISEPLVKYLRPKRFPVNTRVTASANVLIGVSKSRVNLFISPKNDQNQAYPISAFVLPKLITYNPPKIEIKSEWDHLRDLDYADPTPLSSEQIDLIIGADYYGSFLLSGLCKGPPGSLTAQHTVFGWILSGPISENNIQTQSDIQINRISTEQELSFDLKRFWELEEVSQQSMLTKEEQRCEDHFIKTHWRTKDGRYVVRLPPKEESFDSLGKSLPRALSLLYGVERRLAKNPDLAKRYEAFLEEYENLGHMRQISDLGKTTLLSCPPVYLPHHPVIRESSTSTPVRIVFNASSPTSSGKSLNDLLLVGPKLQNDLPAIILRWRNYKFGLTADISKMFRQILLDPRDVDLQRIVCNRGPSREMVHYQLMTVTYGTASAPFLANRVLKQLAEDEGINYPEASTILKNDFYVDDVLLGADDLKQALHLKKDLIELLDRGGFPLRKWVANDPTLITGSNALSEDKTVSFGEFKDEAKSVLGLRWCPRSDNFLFLINIRNFEAVTKRIVLSLIARIFDPHGWLAPVIIVAKMFMQELWLKKLDWDDFLPQDLRNKWNAYYESLTLLQNLKISRWNGLSGNSKSVELHGFADASSKAYGAAIYLKIIDQEKRVKTTLLIAKSKTAPIITVCIPRLELCAAVLLAKLAKQVVNSMNLSETPLYCWSDAMVVLSWLSKVPSTWPTFVANRVALIYTLIPDAKWNHVPTSLNPVDCLSRGITAEELINHPLWWHGPSFLHESQRNWPNSVSPEILEIESKKYSAVSLKKKKVLKNQPEVQFHATQIEPSPLDKLAEKVSTWPKLIRITAYCIRFIDHILKRSIEPKESFLSNEILNRAKIGWFKYLQERHFSNEISLLKNNSSGKYSNPLRSLCPFLGSDGLLRVKGRLENAPISYDAKHPIILPKTRVTDLIIEQAHQRTLHGGPQLTLHVLRQNYWILKAHNSVRSVINKCIPCVREKAKVPSQMMGQLPSARVTRSRPFEHAGLDYAGPFLVKMGIGRGYKAHKAYISLFVCLATRAVHLELVCAYTTEAFLATFKRFVARRGLPSNLYSDNGTNFQGADKELQRTFRNLTSDEKVRNFFSEENIKWHFNPAAAPHFGGLWEAGVKSVKHHLRRIIGDHKLTIEEFSTLLCQIEASLNSRPLSALSDDHDNLTYLTPGHFLTGSPLLSVPEQSVLDLTENRLSRWQLVQRFNEILWRRWSLEYFQGLQNRYKWQKPSSNIRVGDIVLLREKDAPPCKWTLGRVTACHPGQDNLVRSITIKTAKGTYDRPIVQVCLLPVHNAKDL